MTRSATLPSIASICCGLVNVRGGKPVYGGGWILTVIGKDRTPVAAARLEAPRDATPSGTSRDVRLRESEAATINEAAAAIPTARTTWPEGSARRTSTCDAIAAALAKT